jgi:hypothetical protein
VQLLLSFHGRGSDFTGVLVCAPVFELLFSEDDDPRGSRDRTQIHVTDQPFEFYFSETREDLIPRFLRWLEEVPALAISQYQRSL